MLLGEVGLWVGTLAVWSALESTLSCGLMAPAYQSSRYLEAKHRPHRLPHPAHPPYGASSATSACTLSLGCAIHVGYQFFEWGVHLPPSPLISSETGSGALQADVTKPLST